MNLVVLTHTHGFWRSPDFENDAFFLFPGAVVIVIENYEMGYKCLTNKGIAWINAFPR